MYLYINSNYGSITHYYHFFYGVFIPLVLISIKNNKEKFNLVGNIGPMKRIIYELPFDISFLSRCEVKYLKNENKHFYDLVPLDSSKTKMKHKEQITYEDKIKLCDFFQKNIPKFLLSLKFKDIVVIERGVEPLYQHQDYSKKHKMLQELGKQSGKERRYNKNHNEILEMLEKDYKDKYENIILERTSVYYQYLLFKNAKIVIANHGAGLSNIIFMNKNCGVIEIMSKLKLYEQKEDLFINLGKIFKLNYKTIITEEEKADVDINELKENIKKLYNNK